MLDDVGNDFGNLVLVSSLRGNLSVLIRMLCDAGSPRDNSSIYIFSNAMHTT